MGNADSATRPAAADASNEDDGLKELLELSGKPVGTTVKPDSFIEAAFVAAATTEPGKNNNKSVAVAALEKLAVSMPEIFKPSLVVITDLAGIAGRIAGNKIACCKLAQRLLGLLPAIKQTGLKAAETTTTTTAGGGASKKPSQQQQEQEIAELAADLKQVAAECRELIQKFAMPAGTASGAALGFSQEQAAPFVASAEAFFKLHGKVDQIRDDIAALKTIVVSSRLRRVIDLQQPSPPRFAERSRLVALIAVADGRCAASSRRRRWRSEIAQPVWLRSFATSD
jgi:hypothetical protein